MTTAILPVDFARMHPVAKAFLAGSISGTCSTLLLQPLDLLKTRIQAAPRTSANYAPGGMVTLCANVLRTEKVIGLWTGLTPSLWRCVPGVGLYFCSLQMMKSNFGSENPGNLELISLGASARCLSGIALLPVTVVKVRVESGKFQYGSVMNGLRTIYSLEGARGLYSGALATILRDAPSSGLYLLFYTNAKKYVQADLFDEFSLPLVHFSCGVAAGVMASVVTQPADVVKTRMQTRTTTVSAAITHIYKMNGLSGFMSGIVPRTLRRTMMAALAWTMYERITFKLSLK